MCSDLKEELVLGESPKSHRCLPLLCMLASLEDADLVLLPTSFFALQHDLGLGLGDLAAMSMMQGLCSTFSAPIWSLLADKGMVRRKSLVAGSCMAQGFFVLMLSGASSLPIILMLRALNGLSLSAMKPIAKGIIPDITPENNCGKAFSCMEASGKVGAILGMALAVNLTGHTIAGLQGWRIAFASVGIIALAIATIIGFYMEEPPRPAAATAFSSKKTSGSVVHTAVHELMGVLSVFRLRSFNVTLVQGMAASVACRALNFQTLYYQLWGLSGVQISLIGTTYAFAVGLGSLLGGLVSDTFYSWSRRHGRVFCGQLSMLIGMPSLYFLFNVAPPAGYAYLYFSVIVAINGLLGQWSYLSVLLPTLSMLVPKKRRSTVLSTHGAIDISFGVVCGNLLVSFIAQNIFGYDFHHVDARSGTVDLRDAKALGNALFMVSLIPMMFSFAGVSCLHWSLPLDLDMIAAAEEKEQQDQQQQQQEQEQEEKHHQHQQLRFLENTRSQQQQELALPLTTEAAEEDVADEEAAYITPPARSSAAELLVSRLPSTEKLFERTRLPTLLQQRAYQPLSQKEIELENNAAV